MDIQKLNSRLNKLNKILLIIFAVSVGIWAGVGFWAQDVAQDHQQLKANLCDASETRNMLARLNSDLPKQLDELTTLNAIACDSQRFVYRFELGKGAGVSAKEFSQSDREEFRAEQAEQVRQTFCTDARIKAVRELAQGIDFIYEIGGENIAKISLNSSECK